MSTGHKNLGNFSDKPLTDISSKRFGIICSEWNNQVTDALLDGAVSTLLQIGVSKEDILLNYVPGTFELPLGAQRFAQRNDIDAIICLGCVIQGETRHFDFICDATANGIMQVCLQYDKPVIFGVLTTDNLQQALDRSGGKHGNKGEEAALTAVKMLG